MRKLFPVILCLIVLPAVALATEDCAECRLGIFDGPDITNSNNYGSIDPFVAKDLYVGIQLPPGETGVTGIEFSITGLIPATDHIQLLSTEGIAPGLLPVGSAPAPADTSAASVGTGGMNAGWGTCVSGGSQMLLHLQVLALQPVVNHVFRIMRKFPTSNPVNFPNDAVFTRCDAPNYTTVKIKKLGCYTANWDGTSQTCPLLSTAVVDKTWSAVKTLYSN